MARARNIKPGLYKNEDLAECSVWARYIFPGMWMLADREGRMEDRPKRIKGELLPYDSVEIEPLLEELVAFGFIVRYSVNGVRYIQICKFADHQTPHVREQPSAIPGPEHADQVQSTTKVVTKHCLGSDEPSPRSPDSLIPSSLIPDSLIEEDASAKQPPNSKGTRLSADWEPSDEEIEFCRTERRDLDPKMTASRFRDYWIAQPGAKGRKTDWAATWRNWVRNEKTQPARASPSYQTKHDQTKAFVDALTGNRNEHRSPSADIIDIN